MRHTRRYLVESDGDLVSCLEPHQFIKPSALLDGGSPKGDLMAEVVAVVAQEGVDADEVVVMMLP